MADKTTYVLLAVTSEATVAQTREYVDDAVQGWGGCHHPEDPFFGDNKKVEIKYAGRKDPRHAAAAKVFVPGTGTLKK